VRLLLIDDADRLLLLHYATPDTAEEFWLTPGGALDPGESAEAAAGREAWEELGIRLPALGPAVWNRVHRFRIGDGRLFVQQETFHVHRVATFAPSPQALSAFERESYRGHRWWTAAEFCAGESLPLQPARLGVLFSALLADGLPPNPVDVSEAPC
jgi:8-oxo-dGTP pyrophosphatase MutT (NUDIX family)